MTKVEIQTAAEAIGDLLIQCEVDIESSIENLAHLVSRLGEMKRLAGLTVFHSQDTLESASELMVALSQSRRKAANLHRDLDASQKQIGIRPISYGVIGKPPATASLTVTPVRSVA